MERLPDPSPLLQSLLGHALPPSLALIFPFPLAQVSITFCKSFQLFVLFYLSNSYIALTIDQALTKAIPLLLRTNPTRQTPSLSSFHRKGNWGRVRLGRARIQIQVVNYYSLGCITSQRISRRTLVLQGSQYPLLQKDFLSSSFSLPFPWYHVPGWSCLLISSQQIRVQHLCCLAHSSTTLSAPCSQTACLSISENPMPVPSGSSRNLCWRMRSSMNEQMDTMLGRQ